MTDEKVIIDRKYDVDGTHVVQRDVTAIKVGVDQTTGKDILKHGKVELGVVEDNGHVRPITPHQRGH